MKLGINSNAFFPCPNGYMREEDGWACFAISSDGVGETETDPTAAQIQACEDDPNFEWDYTKKECIQKEVAQSDKAYKLNAKPTESENVSEGYQKPTGSISCGLAKNTTQGFAAYLFIGLLTLCALRRYSLKRFVLAMSQVL